MTLLYPRYNDIDVNTEFFKEKITEKKWEKQGHKLQFLIVRTESFARDGKGDFHLG